MAIIKTFFYLRIFKSLSYIVVLLKDVIKGLKAFIIFYMMLVFLFSLIFSVLGLGNPNIKGGFKDFVDSRPDDWSEDIPHEEYSIIGPFLGSLFFVIRCSVGDFDFNASTYLTPAENVIFWIAFMAIFLMNSLVFLNFVISEIGATYEKTRSQIEGLVMKDKADLITEAQDMTMVFMNQYKMPKYIIVRQADTWNIRLKFTNFNFF